MDEREKIIEIIAPFVSAYGEDEAISTVFKEISEKYGVSMEDEQ